jgi:hypothetical protein
MDRPPLWHNHNDVYITWSPHGFPPSNILAGPPP